MTDTDPEATLAHVAETRDDWSDATMEERIAAVWELTLERLAQRGVPDAGEPRLDKSVGRLIRPPRRARLAARRSP